MNKQQISKKLELVIIKLMFFVLFVFVIYGCNTVPGKVLNPKLPDTSKPVDLIYCDKDEDCTATGLRDNTCCTTCPRSINLKGKKYLEEWRKLNCAKPGSFRNCPLFECPDISIVKCENNKCIVIYNS